jgi:hypothetical protein
MTIARRKARADCGVRQLATDERMSRVEGNVAARMRNADEPEG